MDLTKEYLNTLGAAAKAYDAEKNMEKRHALGARLDELIDPLSDGQLRQVAKIISRL